MAATLLAQQIGLSHLPHFKNRVDASRFQAQSFTGTIHLYCLNLFRRDGVSNHCFEMATFWSLLGINVKLYSGGASDADRAFIAKPEELKKNFNPATDRLFFMFSIGDPFLDEVIQWTGKKVIFFQGITPPHLVAAIGEQVRKECEYGIAQYPLLQKFDLVGFSSIFNLNELQRAQSQAIPSQKLFWLPPVVSMDKFQSIPATKPAWKTDSKPYLLYVGRIFPNKNIHAIVELFARMRLMFNGNLNLYIVGSGHLHGYKEQISNLISSHFKNDPSAVRQIEDIDDSSLLWLYQNGLALAHLSLHEGFGLTLLEAMSSHLPIITHDHAAIKETTKHAGIFIDSTNLDAAARQVSDLLLNKTQLEAVRAVQDFAYHHYYSDQKLQDKYHQITERIVRL